MADHIPDASNMVPRRIQLRRTAGWRMPANTVKVDRSTKWGNPFVPGKPGGQYTAMVMNRRHAWQLFRSVARTTPAMREAARELRGKNLACWCPLPEPGFDDECHASVWLELANGPLRCEAVAEPDEPLPIGTATIRVLTYECPACGAPYELDDTLLSEDNGGGVAPTGPERFPVCDGCGLQFECEAVVLLPVDTLIPTKEDPDA